MDVDEHDIEQPLSLTNKLLSEDSLDQEILLTILDEEATSRNNSLYIIKHITTQFSDISNITEPVSLQTTDESIPQADRNNLRPIVSQTQTGINDSYADSDDEERPITMAGNDPQFDEIAK